MPYFWNFITKYVKFKDNSEETQFSEKKVVFHEIKKVNSSRFVVVMSHYTVVAGNVVNFNMRNITFHYKREQKKNFTRIWNQNEK